MTFEDIVFGEIHYTLIKSHHDNDENEKLEDDVDNEHQRSDNILRSGFFMSDELIWFWSRGFAHGNEFLWTQKWDAYIIILSDLIFKVFHFGDGHIPVSRCQRT